MKDIIEVKIYYEDTDCGGVVYYANYLKYFERARTEFLEKRGILLKDLMKEGIYFVVVSVELKYHTPGRYADILVVESTVEDVGYASIVFHHRVIRKATEELIVSGMVKIASVSDKMRPVRIPQKILYFLQQENVT
jgi:acyl-CoA thioester hydrolase